MEEESDALNASEEDHVSGASDGGGGGSGGRVGAPWDVTGIRVWHTCANDEWHLRVEGVSEPDQDVLHIQRALLQVPSVSAQIVLDAFPFHFALTGTPPTSVTLFAFASEGPEDAYSIAYNLDGDAGERVVRLCDLRQHVRKSVRLALQPRRTLSSGGGVPSVLLPVLQSLHSIGVQHRDARGSSDSSIGRSDAHDGGGGEGDANGANKGPPSPSPSERKGRDAMRQEAWDSMMQSLLVASPQQLMHKSGRSIHEPKRLIDLTPPHGSSGTWRLLPPNDEVHTDMYDSDSSEAADANRRSSVDPTGGGSLAVMRRGRTRTGGGRGFGRRSAAGGGGRRSGAPLSAPSSTFRRAVGEAVAAAYSGGGSGAAGGAGRGGGAGGGGEGGGGGDAEGVGASLNATVAALHPPYVAPMAFTGFLRHTGGTGSRISSRSSSSGYRAFVRLARPNATTDGDNAGAGAAAAGGGRRGGRGEGGLDADADAQVLQRRAQSHPPRARPSGGGGDSGSKGRERWKPLRASGPDAGPMLLPRLPSMSGDVDADGAANDDVGGDGGGEGSNGGGGHPVDAGTVVVCMCMVGRGSKWRIASFSEKNGSQESTLRIAGSLGLRKERNALAMLFPRIPRRQWRSLPDEQHLRRSLAELEVFEAADATTYSVSLLLFTGHEGRDASLLSNGRTAAFVSFLRTLAGPNALYDAALGAYTVQWKGVQINLLMPKALRPSKGAHHVVPEPEHESVSIVFMDTKELPPVRPELTSLRIAHVPPSLPLPVPRRRLMGRVSVDLCVMRCRREAMGVLPEARVSRWYVARVGAEPEGEQDLALLGGEILQLAPTSQPQPGWWYGHVVGHVPTAVRTTQDRALTYDDADAFFPSDCIRALGAQDLYGAWRRCTMLLFDDLVMVVGRKPSSILGLKDLVYQTPVEMDTPEDMDHFHFFLPWHGCVVGLEKSVVGVANETITLQWQSQGVALATKCADLHSHSTDDLVTMMKQCVAGAPPTLHRQEASSTRSSSGGGGGGGGSGAQMAMLPTHLAAAQDMVVAVCPEPAPMFSVDVALRRMSPFPAFMHPGSPPCPLDGDQARDWIFCVITNAIHCIRRADRRWGEGQRRRRNLFLRRAIDHQLATYDIGKSGESSTQDESYQQLAPSGDAADHHAFGPLIETDEVDDEDVSSFATETSSFAVSHAGATDASMEQLTLEDGEVTLLDILCRPQLRLWVDRVLERHEPTASLCRDVAFFDAVYRMKQRLEQPMDAMGVMQLVISILDTFIAKGSPKAIDMPLEMRRRLQTEIQRASPDVSPNVFDAALDATLRRLQDQLFNPFVASLQAQMYLQEEVSTSEDGFAYAVSDPVHSAGPHSTEPLGSIHFSTDQLPLHMTWGKVSPSTVSVPKVMPPIPDPLSSTSVSEEKPDDGDGDGDGDDVADAEAGVAPVEGVAATADATVGSETPVDAQHQGYTSEDIIIGSTGATATPTAAAAADPVAATPTMPSTAQQLVVDEAGDGDTVATTTTVGDPLPPPPPTTAEPVVDRDDGSDGSQSKADSYSFDNAALWSSTPNFGSVPWHATKPSVAQPGHTAEVVMPRRGSQASRFAFPSPQRTGMHRSPDLSWHRVHVDGGDDASVLRAAVTRDRAERLGRVLSFVDRCMFASVAGPHELAASMRASANMRTVLAPSVRVMEVRSLTLTLWARCLVHEWPESGPFWLRLLEVLHEERDLHAWHAVWRGVTAEAPSWVNEVQPLALTQPNAWDGAHGDAAAMLSFWASSLLPSVPSLPQALLPTQERESSDCLQLVSLAHAVIVRTQMPMASAMPPPPSAQGSSPQPPPHGGLAFRLTTDMVDSDPLLRLAVCLNPQVEPWRPLDATLDPNGRDGSGPMGDWVQSSAAAVRKVESDESAASSSLLPGDQGDRRSF